MTYIGGGAESPEDFLKFLGLVKDQRVPPVGSPFQMNFPEAVPDEIQVLNVTIPGCGSPGY